MSSININQDQSPVLTKKEFCKIYKISMATLDRLIRDKKGPKIIKLDHKVLITKDSIAEWLKSKEI